MSDQSHPTSGESDTPRVEFFYAERDGVKVTWHGPIKTPWGDVEPVKVDESELCLEDTPTIHAEIPEED